MNSTEFCERRVLPLVAAFAVGVLLTATAADHERRLERAAALRLMQASIQLEDCTRRLLDALHRGERIAAPCRLQMPPEPLAPPLVITAR